MLQFQQINNIYFIFHECTTHTVFWFMFVSNLQSCLWYHTAEPTGQVTTDVINFLSVLSTGTILTGVWTVLYDVNSTAFALALLPALLLHTSHTNILLMHCTRGVVRPTAWACLNTLPFIYALFTDN